MISIIVPVYNVEQYLPRCLDSILGQSYRDFEALLIDDGSTDGSGKICDDYARRDSRFRVFHKPNGGVSTARNYGLDRMHGEYITFVDADDFIGPDYLSILLDMLLSNNADITCVATREVRAMQAEFTDSEDVRSVCSMEEIFRIMLTGKKFGVVCWGKLYRAELFDGIRFPEGQIYEDLATIPYVVDKCQRAVISSAGQYYYYQRAGSLSNSISVRDVEMWIKTMDKIVALTQREHPALFPYALTRLVKTTFWWILDRLLASDSYICEAKRLKMTWGRYFKKVWRLPQLTVKERFKVTIFMLNIRLFRVIRLPMIKMKGNQIVK